MTDVVERLLRPGRTGAHEVRVDLYWLCALALLLIATGIGLRDPWPADEPRFALIARDMVARGEWLIPQVGNDTYADKPPLFFWLIAGAFALTHSLRVAFLLPSFLAGLGCVLLIYDLARRLWNREIGLAAGVALLTTVQFVWQARQAQIDAVLCFWTTLSLYALLRHLLLGPAWRWYCVGWFAAGLGIITKGVGFLPLLVLIPYALARRGWQPRPSFAGSWRFFLGPLALLLAVSIWLAPMLLAASGDPELARYRDEILFRQTVDRYAQAWHHREPFWYFVVEVIPFLWLPLTALVPWLWSSWRERFRARDLRVLLPLAWVVLVVVFFSLSSGKRGVYVLPAVPALVLASAPFIADVLRRVGARRTLFGIACALAAIGVLGAIYLLAAGGERQRLIDDYDIDALGPLLAIGLGCALTCLIFRTRNAFAAWGVSLILLLAIVSYWANPVMNDARSSAGFVRSVEARASDIRELGFVAYKEQYLLYTTRPTVNFGHARWREAEQEASDAAAWLAGSPDRALLVDARVRALCFSAATAREVGSANRQQWFIVSGAAVPDCIRRGKPETARTYQARGQR